MIERLGWPRVHHRRVDSTNERARALAAAGAPHGTLVTADEQTAGRGRSGRSWVAPAGAALLMSVLLRGLGERDSLLPLAAAVAVCEACERVLPARCAIKWPNDVWLDGRKLAGVLVEGRPQEGWAVVGIGVNVATEREGFPPDLRESATSLRIAGAAADVTAAALLPVLLEALADGRERPRADVLAAWRERDALRGSHIAWDRGEGVAAGVDEAGALLVETADGVVSLDAGEVHLGHPAGR